MFILNKKQKYLLLFVFCFFTIPGFCDSLIQKIEGSWVPRYVCDETIDYSVWSIKKRDVDGLKIIRDDGIIVEDNNDGTGLFGIVGISRPWKIFSTKTEGNKIFLNAAIIEYDFDGVSVTENVSENLETITITIVDVEEIIFDNFGYQKGTHFYRISGPAKIPVKNAKISDNRVRLRVKPNLTCDTWAFLDKDLPVKIKDKSSEPFEIDGEKWYWYKVDNSNYPDGWVYGKYLDIEK